MKKIFGFLLFVSCLAQVSMAQEKTARKAKYTKATFGSTRIINMQSVEIISPGNLQFMIAHHFSNAWNKDAKGQNFVQMFGLNSGLAYTYLSLDYSPTRWMNFGAAGAGKSNFEGWLKFKLLRQQSGLMNMPVTVTWLTLTNVDASSRFDQGPTVWNRYTFMHQLLLARKFSDKFSMQVMPTMIHFNRVPYGKNNSNDVFSMGMAAKWKMASNKNLTFEYSRQMNMYENLLDKNGNIINYVPNLFSMGMEFNTGGHLFQLFLSTTTNSSNIDQLARNTNSLKDAQFALGFNINRGFNLKN